MGGPLTWAYDEWRDWLTRKGSRPPQKIKDRLQEDLPKSDGTIIISTHAHTAVKPQGAQLVLLQGDIFGGRSYAANDAELIAVPEDSSKDELISYGVSPDKICKVWYFLHRCSTSTACYSFVPRTNPQPINRTNAGKNTHAAIERGIAPTPEATRHLHVVLQGNLTSLKERIERAQTIPTDGAENIAGVIADFSRR